jgi:hypothetical protein
LSSTGENSGKLTEAQTLRLQAIRDRLDRSNQTFLAAAMWGQSFPEPFQADAGLQAFADGVSDVTKAATVVVALLRPGWGVAKSAFEAGLLGSADRLNAVMEALVDFDLKTRLVLGLLPAMEKLRQQSGTGTADKLVQVRFALQHVAALALIDATWVSGLAGRVASQTLNSPAEQTAFRMTKHRRRKREKLAAVTLTYHESDLETLRALGFLVGRDKKPSAGDLAAAFEAFQQASMAAAFAGRVETSSPARFNPGAYLNAWAERVAALARVNGASPSRAAAE